MLRDKLAQVLESVYRLEPVRSGRRNLQSLFSNGECARRIVEMLVEKPCHEHIIQRLIGRHFQGFLKVLLGALVTAAKNSGQLLLDQAEQPVSAAISQRRIAG